jgi:hypothetical protein
MMDVYAELAARQKRPAKPTMGTVQSLAGHPDYHHLEAAAPRMPKMASSRSRKVKSEVETTTTTTTTTTVDRSPPAAPAEAETAQGTASTSEPPAVGASSPASPQRIVSRTMSTGSSPTKTNSSSSSYEIPPTYQQFHPSHRSTAPMYRPAALRSADHPSTPPPFGTQSPGGSTYPSHRVGVEACKRDHWKVVTFLTLVY